MFVLIRGDAEELISERANCRTECVQFSEVKDGHVSSAGTCLAWVRNKLSRGSLGRARGEGSNSLLFNFLF